MTAADQSTACPACAARESTLAFPDAELAIIRLKPAQFARLLGVSKTAVSKWIKAGKVTIGPDGKLDPSVAVQQVLKNSAPATLRARIFRQAIDGADAQRLRIASLENEVRLLRGQARALARTHVALADFDGALEQRLQQRARKRVNALLFAVWQSWDRLADAKGKGSTPFFGLLHAMRDQHFYSMAPQIPLVSLMDERPIHPPAT